MNAAGFFQLLILAGMLPATLWAQVPRLRFDHLSVEEGLPSSTVYNIGKDHQGFMWFGTRRCPVRYDGISFRPYLSPEATEITGLAVDSANRVWVTADRGGLFRIGPNQLQMTTVSAIKGQVGTMFVASPTEGWFSSFSGIERIDLRTSAIRHYPLRTTDYYGLKVKAFLKDYRQTLWAIGSDNGLFRFDRRSNRFVCVFGPDCSDPARRSPVYFSSGCAGSDHYLWLGTFGRGLLRYDPDTDHYQFFSTHSVQDNVTCVGEGHDDTGRRVLWIGNVDGLMVYRPEQEHFFRIESLIPNQIVTEPTWIYAVFQDPTNGILWVGTSNGIYKHNSQESQVQSIRLPIHLTRQLATVNVMLADRTDTTGQTFFLGLSNTGFVRWHRPTNQFRLVRYPSKQAETMWMQQTANGQLWIGLRRWDRTGDGLLVYDPAKGQFVTNPVARQASRLFSAPFIDQGLFDSRGKLWIGNTDEGARAIDLRTGLPVAYCPDSSIHALHAHNNFLTGLAQDRTGRIWLSTYRGLFCIDEEHHRFSRANGSSSRPQELAANALLISPRTGHLWASCWDRVVESLPNGSIVTQLTSRNGLWASENRQLAEDAYGTVWIGNAEGLYNYSPVTHRLLQLTTGDGLTRNNTTKALLCHRGYELFIGQMGGFDFIDLRQLHRPHPPVQAVISTVRVHEQERPFDPTKPLQIDKADNALSIDFSPLSYSRLVNGRCAYFLAGFDRNWHYSTDRPRASYTNLDPGQYILNVRLADSFGRWSQPPTTLLINVHPAYYETGWFRLLVLLLAGGLLYGLYRYRLYQLLRLQQMRTQISANLHDEIGSSLSSIGILGTLARQSLPDQHPTGSLLDRITTEARNLSSSLDDIVWSINPRNDDFTSLLVRMHRQAADLFETAQLDYQITMPTLPPSLQLAMEKRYNFYLIFKEAITNVVKHARCTHVAVMVQLNLSTLVLEIRDNGVGFDLLSATDRSGIRNMQERARNLRGTLVIDSHPTVGTTLRLQFPIDPKGLLT